LDFHGTALRSVRTKIPSTGVCGGRTYDVVFFSSLRTGADVTPAIAAEFDRTFRLVRSLPCDAPLDGAANPFVDKAHCLDEADIQEAMYRAILASQK
jgi:hypothetical protein